MALKTPKASAKTTAPKKTPAKAISKAAPKAAAKPDLSPARPLPRPKAATLPSKKTPSPKKTPAAKPKSVPSKMKISAEERMETPKPKPKTQPLVEKKAGNYFYANGKRKTSVALVRLYANGKGNITVNDRAFENYFPVATDQDKITSPLRITNSNKLFDITVRVLGGGIHSQAEAVRHGISKALLLFNLELRTTLKHAGFLTRDSRVKERKKYGLKRARRAPQWQKR